MLLTSIREAPFIYSCWKNPVVLEKICQVAGIELVPAVDYELAHINLSTKTEAQKATELAALPDKALAKQGERDDADAIVGWHTDSYPFVCVTMLSDCTNMIGGETALRTGDGKIMKVRGPQMV